MHSYFKIKRQKKDYKAIRSYKKVLRSSINQSYFFAPFFGLGLDQQIDFIKSSITTYANIEFVEGRMTDKQLNKILEVKSIMYVMRKVYTKFINYNKHLMISETYKRRPDLRDFYV